MTNETKFSIETTFSITHFTSEEFRKYREEHEDENTKVHELRIGFCLDPYDYRDSSTEKAIHGGAFTLYKTNFLVKTVVKEDVKSGKVETIEKIFEKFETQEQMVFEIYGYSSEAALRGEGLKVKYKNFLVKGFHNSFETTLEKSESGEIEKFYYTRVYGELLNDDFEKEQNNNDK